MHDTEPTLPLASPLGADLHGPPPLLIHAAEALSSSAQRLADSAAAAGVPVTFEPAEDSVHSCILFDFPPESSRALDQFASFVLGCRRWLRRDPSLRVLATMLHSGESPAGW
ncbi:MAG: alpha/beta hydrolase [Streptosporangiaceae bacterium]